MNYNINNVLNVLMLGVLECIFVVFSAYIYSAYHVSKMKAFFMSWFLVVCLPLSGLWVFNGNVSKLHFLTSLFAYFLTIFFIIGYKVVSVNDSSNLIKTEY